MGAGEPRMKIMNKYDKKPRGEDPVEREEFYSDGEPENFADIESDGGASQEPDEESFDAAAVRRQKINRYLFIGTVVAIILLWMFSDAIKNYFVTSRSEVSTGQKSAPDAPVILREKNVGAGSGDAVTALSLSVAPGSTAESLATLTESGELKILDSEWNVVGEFKSPETTIKPEEGLSEKTISFANGDGSFVLSGSENGRVSQYIRLPDGKWTKRELFTFRDSTPGLDNIVATGTITHILLSSDNSRGVFFNYDGQGVIMSRGTTGFAPSGKIALTAGMVTGGFDSAGKLWTLARDGTFAVYDAMNPQTPTLTFGVGDFAFLYGADWNGKRLVVCGDNPDSPIPVIGVYGSDGKAEKLLRAPAVGTENFDYQSKRIAQDQTIATINQPGNYFSQVSWLDENRVGAAYQNSFTVFDLKGNTLQQIKFSLSGGETLTGFRRRTASSLVFATDRGRILDAEVNLTR